MELYNKGTYGYNKNELYENYGNYFYIDEKLLMMNKR